MFIFTGEQTLMKYFVRTVLLFLLAALLPASCEREGMVPTGLEASSWRVTRYQEAGKLRWERLQEGPLLIFVDGGNYLLKLDVNVCEGEYRLFSHGEIYFSGSACTKVCCDGTASLKVRSLLPRMTKAEQEGDHLYLKGKGRIELKKVSSPVSGVR